MPAWRGFGRDVAAVKPQGSGPRRVTLAACLALGLMAALPNPVAAEFKTGHYSHRDYDGCGGPAVDPISIVFEGYSSQSGTVRSNILRVMGWTQANSTDQVATSSGHCTTMELGAATCTGCGSRTHVRLNQTWELDNKGRYDTVGTPHYDRTRSGCSGHVVPPGGYVNARYELTNRYYNAGYSYFYQNWGNTYEILQCGGYYVASDGYAAWVRAP